MLLRIPLLVAAALAAFAVDAHAIVYRDDETDATALGLADQPQFSGTGIVVNGANDEQGTGEAISPNWILTAAHVVTGYSTATFDAPNGQSITGSVYLDTPTSDMALIHLNTPLQTTYGGSYTPVAIITPNLPGSAKVQPVGPLIWNVGYGDYGTVSGTINGLDDRRRAGTNNVTGYGNSFLYFYNRNTTGTEFESSTASGDSGGPMFLQNGYQWLVVAEVNGAGSNGFQDTDVTFDNFITTTTGLTFAPQAAPTSLTWNTNYLNASTAASKSITNNMDGGGVWDTTRLDFVGATSGGNTYTYAWQNGTLLPVTFGIGSGTAGTVTLGSAISISNLTFAATGSGNYTIAGGGYALTLQATGSTITTNIAATISAPMVDASGGTSSLIKAGPATLTLSGANTYSAGTTINAGTLALSGSGTLGSTSGALVLNNTGSTLDLGGTSQAVGDFTGTTGTSVTNNGAAAGTLTVGIGNAGSSATNATNDSAFRVVPSGLPGQSRAAVSATNGTGTFAGVLQNGTSTLALAKVGAATITLSGANTYSGGTTVSGGTLALTAGSSIGTGALTFNGTGTLDLGTNTQTVSSLAAGTSTTAFTGSVTDGSLTVSGANSFSFAPFNNGSSTSVLDLSGLTAFSYNQAASGQTFAVTVGESGSTTANTTVNLANGATGNTITASSLNVGTYANSTGGIGTLNLGNSNIIDTNAIVLGGYRSSGGTVEFNTTSGEAVGSNASLTLRNIAGGVAPVSSLTIGLVQSGGGTNTAVFDTSAGAINAIVNNVYVSSVGTNAPGSSQSGTLNLGTGTFNAGTIFVGYTAQSSVSATTNNATVSQNSGAVLADALTFAQDAGTTPGTALTTVGMYNLGTSSTTAILSAAAINIGTASSTSSTETLNFNNGTIENYDNTANGFSGQGNANGSTTTNMQNLVIQGLAGGGAGGNNTTLTVDLASTGTHTFNAESGSTITVASTALITGAGSLTKAGGGSLTLAVGGTANYTGATAINAGAVFANGALTGTSGITVAGGGTLGGGGTIMTGGNGSVTVAAGGQLSPGTAGAGSVGMLTLALGTGSLDVSAATAANDGVFVFDLATTGASDEIRLTSGTLNIGVGTLGLNDFAFNTLAGFGAGTYTLLSEVGLIEGTLDPTNFTGVVGGRNAVLSDLGTTIDLVVTTPVPEPGTWALLGLGAAGLLGARRWRRSRSG